MPIPKPVRRKPPAKKMLKILTPLTAKNRKIKIRAELKVDAKKVKNAFRESARLRKA